MITPEYIFESSWEVCNKVGGIYTVLSSKAQTLTLRHKDKVIFVGPDLGNNPDDFEEDFTLFADWKMLLPTNLKVRTGRWLVPGRPVVMLIAYKTFSDKRDSLYYDMWKDFGVDSSRAYGDYDESCIFAYSVGLTIENFYNFYELGNKNVVALFNEWMLCMGALYLQKHVPAIATVFTTHATTIGRSIAGNNKPLYGQLPAYNGDQMAKELNVEAKHSLEKQTARAVDCFTTVSEITAIECKQLLDKAPDIVTPNGFEDGFVPQNGDYPVKREEARKTLMNVVTKLTGKPVANDAFFIATSGRYEYRNKGIDVFIDTINKLRKNSGLKREIVAFIMVPAWVYAARADLKYVLENNIDQGKPLQTPFITHWLHNTSEDKVLNFILSSGFTNESPDNVRIVFVPCYLDYHDQILNRSYYDLLIGMDTTVFASYYEPWGYTPMESIAFGIPTITTDLAGFGLWVKSIVSGGNIEEGVAVTHRSEDNYFEVVDSIARHIETLMNADGREEIRKRCFAIARRAGWDEFIKYYYAAFDCAFFNAKKRKKQV